MSEVFSPDKLTSILVVDDEPTNLLLMEEALKDVGQLISTTDPLEALDLAFQFQPQLTILDIDMPIMDGHELCHHLLNNPITRNTTVIFVTSHSESEIEARSLQSGALDFITKPIDLSLCRLRVLNHLQLRLKSEELAIAHDDMQGLLSQLPVFISYWSQDWRLRYCNDYAVQWFGFSHTNNKLQPIDVLMPESFNSQLNLALDKGELEFRYESDDGDSPRYYQVYISHKDSSETSGGFIISAADITNIVLTKKALQEEKEWLNVTLNSIGDAVIATDTNANVTFMNPIAERMTGWSANDAKGTHIETVMNLCDATTKHKSVNPIQVALQENRTVAMALNCQLTAQCGDVYRVEDSAAPIRDKNNNVIGAIIVFHDVSETVAMSVKMSHLANHDPLTDLPNRVLLHDRLSNDIQIAQRQGHKVAMFLIDIDNFKYLNDAKGHHVGDSLIKLVAERLTAHCPVGYTLARAGGDEFIIVANDIHHIGMIDSKATELLLALEQPYTIEGNRHKITASMGISIYPDDAQTEETILRYADTAMYRAKQQGKNQHCFFSQELESELLQRHTVEAILRTAIETDTLDVYFQPQYHLKSQTILGCEALARLRESSTGKIISPVEFIPIAEDCGLINKLGLQVLSKSCAVAKKLLDAGKPMKVSVNVAAKQFTAKDFVNSVERELQQHQLPSQYLELEVTESTLMNDFDETRQALEQLKSLGISIAIDDFGTGYSSLSYLKFFPIDVLKIDRSFVSEMLNDEQSLNIVRTIIHLARSLDLNIIAEGIEKEGENQMLKELGCEMGQGYLFAKPISEEELRCLLSLK